MTAAEVKAVDKLEKYRGEIADLTALVSSAQRLVGGMLLTGEPDDAANDEEAAEAAAGLLSIARRQLRYLSAELDDEIARLGGEPSESASA